MTRFAPLWQQAGSYPSQLDRYLLGALWPSGGLLGGAASAVADTMNISLAAGSAGVPLQPGQGSALCHWDAAELVTLDAAPPTGESRVDLIVAQVRDNQIDGGPFNDWVFQVVTGTPAVLARVDTRDEPPEDEVEPRAVAPAVPANALALYAVTVPGGAANLNGATITPVTTNALSVPTASPTTPAGRLQSSGSSGPYPPGTFTIVAMGSYEYLVGGMDYATRGNGLRVPVSGIYAVSFSCVFNTGGGNVAPATYYNVYLVVNGLTWRQESGSLGSPAVPSFGLTDNIILTKGDDLQLAVTIGAPNVYVADLQPKGTYLSAALLSPT